MPATAPTLAASPPSAVSDDRERSRTARVGIATLKAVAVVSGLAVGMIIGPGLGVFAGHLLTSLTD